MGPTRRLAAILAADVVGFSRLMGEDEAGTFAALRAMRTVVDPILAGHGGRIANTAGDSIIAEFTSVAQAVDAAVEIQRNPSPGASGLQLRIGVNLGDVIVTDDGDIFGDGVNIAARLEATAPAGGIVIAGSVRDSLRGRSPVEFEDLGPQLLKNIEDPIHLYRALLDAAPTQQAVPTPPRRGPELLERDEELTRLREALDSAAAGRGQVIIVSGEAGIGKSSLLREFVSTLDSRIEVAWGWCDDLVTPRALGPFRDMAPALGPEFSRMISTGAAPDDILAGLHSALSGSTRLLVIEDLHWADDATIDAITFLSRRIERLPVLLAVTARDAGMARTRSAVADAPVGVVTRLVLSPLSARAIAELSGDATSAERMRRLTGGNPFFVSEMVAAGEGSVPSSVQHMVLARIDKLSDQAIKVAQMVAVAPTKLELDLIERILPGSMPALEEAEAARILVVQATEVGYRHELARRAVEESLHVRDRRSWHRKVLDELVDTDADPARLVHHAEGAGDIDAVVRHALVAGPGAAAAGSHHEAAAHFERALAHEDLLDQPTLETVLSAYSWETYLLDRRDPAVAAAQRLLEIHRARNDQESVGDDLRWLSRLYWWQGEGEAARRASDAAVRTLEPLGRTRALAMAYSARSQLAMLQGDDEGTVEWGERAQELANELGEEAISIHATINMATVRARHRPAEGLEELRGARSRAERIGDGDSTSRAWTNLTWNLLYGRDYPTAEAELTALLEYSETHELDAYRVYTLGQLGLVMLETGRWEEALMYAQAGFDGRAVSNVGKVPSLQVLGLLAARQGRFEEAAGFAEMAWDLAAPSDEVQRTGPVASLRCELAWLQYNESTIPEIVQPVLDRAIRIDDRRHVGELRRWLRLAGHGGRPAAEAAPYLTESEGDYRSAADQWRRLGVPYDEAIALFQAGETDAAAKILASLGAQATLRRIGR